MGYCECKVSLEKNRCKKKKKIIIKKLSKNSIILLNRKI